MKYLVFALAIAGCGGSGGNGGGDLAGNADQRGAADLASGGDDGGGGGADLATAGDLTMDMLKTPDMAGRSCVPGGGQCPNSVACGSSCCNPGEWCDSSGAGKVCRCGNNAACMGGDHCASFGPMMIDGCGTICCGVSGPCPG